MINHADILWILARILGARADNTYWFVFVIIISFIFVVASVFNLRNFYMLFLS